MQLYQQTQSFSCNLKTMNNLVNISNHEHAPIVSENFIIKNKVHN